MDEKKSLSGPSAKERLETDECISKVPDFSSNTTALNAFEAALDMFFCIIVPVKQNFELVLKVYKEFQTNFRMMIAKCERESSEVFEACKTLFLEESILDRLLRETQDSNFVAKMSRFFNSQKLPPFKAIADKLTVKEDSHFFKALTEGTIAKNRFAQIRDIFTIAENIFSSPMGEGCTIVTEVDGHRGFYRPSECKIVIPLVSQQAITKWEKKGWSSNPMETLVHELKHLINDKSFKNRAQLFTRWGGIGEEISYQVKYANKVLVSSEEKCKENPRWVLKSSPECLYLYDPIHQLSKHLKANEQSFYLHDDNIKNTELDAYCYEAIYEMGDTNSKAYSLNKNYEPDICKPIVDNFHYEVFLPEAFKAGFLTQQQLDASLAERGQEYDYL